MTTGAFCCLRLEIAGSFSLLYLLCECTESPWARKVATIEQFEQKYKAIVGSIFLKCTVKHEKKRTKTKYALWASTVVASGAPPRASRGRRTSPIKWIYVWSKVRTSMFVPFVQHSISLFQSCESHWCSKKNRFKSILSNSLLPTESLLAKRAN